MSEAKLNWTEAEENYPPPACRICPWYELPEKAAGCLNFKKLLCRLEPAVILERFFYSLTG
ncbi:MAG: hypothetical protein C4567_07040 [Deltaproteobacteria bacterium]|nr:MAG: hypothetical protein C4567_07040 [Deltaproteobacteria bacterium]